eukprot:m.16916 g.16916  ORF g.16916 m.16916 type:complete len:311 (-) comp8178_c0_seq1:218-1150(-)
MASIRGERLASKSARSLTGDQQGSDQLTPTEAAVQRIQQNLDSAPFLDLEGLGLTEVPVEVLRLSQLRGLYLSSNAIDRLPDDLFLALPQLIYLDLRNNRITQLPKTISHAKNLKTLLLGNNRITSLPAELGDLQALTGLNLAGNPIFLPPDEITHQGVNAIKAFLRARTASLIAEPAFVTHPEVDITPDHTTKPFQQSATSSQLKLENPFAWSQRQPAEEDDAHQGQKLEEHKDDQEQLASQAKQKDVSFLGANRGRSGRSDREETESVVSEMASDMVAHVLQRLTEMDDIINEEADQEDSNSANAEES